MSDDIKNASRFYRFTIPPPQLDSPIPRPGPYLFHGAGVQNQNQISLRVPVPFPPPRWNRGEVTSTQTWHYSCSVTSLSCKKMCYDFFYWLTPTSLKQNIYLKSDAETQIYSKNGEWIHFNVVVYLDNLHANTCYFTKKYYQMTLFCIN